MKKISVLLSMIAVFIGTVVVAMTLLTRRARSVSILGGADGPTSIFRPDLVCFPFSKKKRKKKSLLAESAGTWKGVFDFERNAVLLLTKGKGEFSLR